MRSSQQQLVTLEASQNLLETEKKSRGKSIRMWPVSGPFWMLTDF
jgi:hypothetical protein